MAELMMDENHLFRQILLSCASKNWTEAFSALAHLTEIGHTTPLLSQLSTYIEHQVLVLQSQLTPEDDPSG